MPAKINISQENELIVIDLCSFGKSLIEISKIVGIERHVLKRFLISKGVTFRKHFSSLFQNKIIQTYKELKSIKETAIKLNKSPYTIKKCLIFNNIPTKAELNKITRYCSLCKTEKSIECFHKNKNIKNGYDYRCKECRKLLCKKRYSKNRESRVKRKFGITLQLYEKMLKNQDYKCAICGKIETMVDKRHNSKKILSVDHDHNTDKIRGLLCGRCNMALGGFKENPEILNNAINYLKKWNLINS